MDTTINEKLNDVYDAIAEMLKTVTSGKGIYICDSYANVIKGYVSNVNREDKSFDFTTYNGKIMKLYFSDMWLNKSPFCNTDDGDLYISMNVRL